MKAKVFLVCLVAAFATLGSTCVNENIQVPLNVALADSFKINPGSNLNYSGDTLIVMEDLVEEAFRQNITAARFYDIRVWVTGTYNGSVVGGVVTINNLPLLNYAGPWDSFKKPQSLLGKSPLITVSTPGYNELMRVLNQFPSNPKLTVLLASTGLLSGQSPVPAGLMVHYEILTQADADISP